MRKLRGTLAELLDENHPVQDRLNRIVDKGSLHIEGLNRAVLTPILMCVYPEKYAVYNAISAKALTRLGRNPAKSNQSLGEQYAAINKMCHEIKNEIGQPLYLVDVMFSLMIRHPGGTIDDTVLEQAQEQAETEHAFDPDNVQDARERIAASIVRRRGQPQFRKKLLKAYEGRCAISDCDYADALEAAHIHPFRGEKTNHPTNGLLLRSDLHVLFDLGKICVDVENYAVIVSDDLKASSYGGLHGTKLRLPKDSVDKPSAAALKRHRRKTGI